MERNSAKMSIWNMINRIHFMTVMLSLLVLCSGCDKRSSSSSNYVIKNNSVNEINTIFEECLRFHNGIGEYKDTVDFDSLSKTEKEEHILHISQRDVNALEDMLKKFDNASFSKTDKQASALKAILQTDLEYCKADLELINNYIKYKDNSYLEKATLLNEKRLSHIVKLVDYYHAVSRINQS